jgi:hypothetical protein
MTNPHHDPSIEHEPHLRNVEHLADVSEERASRSLGDETARDDSADHTVWDEPTLSAELSGTAGDDQVTYARWLARRLAETSATKSWLTTLLVVLVAGPWGIFGALFGGNGLSFNVALVTIVGPVTEEIMKIAVALWIVERRPYLFKSIAQILLCAAAGGAAFALIENLMYLYVYIPNHSFSLAAWRWTVCVGLHVNCSFVAGVGLARIWDNAIRNLHRPQLGLGMAWFATAIAGHGLYNAAVVVAESAKWLEF